MERLTMTVAEAANALGVGRQTVYGLIRHGHLGHVRFGRVIKVPTAELTNYISSNTKRGDK